MEETASSVERFGRYANWSGSSMLGKAGFDVVHD